MRKRYSIPHSRPSIGREEIAAVTRLLKEGCLSRGERVRQFEQKMARYVGVKDAVATHSGTAALHLALLGLGIFPGQEVIVPSFVCAALLNAIGYVGAKAKVVDIEEDYNLSPKGVSRALTRRTKAIIVPHAFGTPAPLAPLLSLGVPLIEDCAQSLGAEYAGKRVGRFGKVSVFSFYATKVIATGEGGMVASDDTGLLEKIRDLRDYDEKKVWRLRYNYKMTDLQAALGMAQLKKLTTFLKRRREIAARYTSAFKPFPAELPSVPENTRPIFYRYLLKTRAREALMSRLKRSGIDAERPLFRPLHRYLGCAASNFPETERAWREAISIPLYPSLREGEVAHIVHTVCAALEFLIP